jgi:hypothetical protein
MVSGATTAVSESDDSAELASVSRFVDMLVLVNPPIEAARFDPVFSAAQKRVAYCKRNAGQSVLCDQPLYQAPVLAIFTSEGDQATKVAFPLGAALRTTFETTVSEAQRRSIVQTIGWDDNCKTNTLRSAPSCNDTDQDPFIEAQGQLRYRPVGWVWCFKEQAATLPLSLRSDDNAIYNGPLWNVRVSSDVMRNHSDIWNELFSSVLLRLFSDRR